MNIETKITKIREKFEKQLKICNENIEKYQNELLKLQEYRIKLTGGFETLELLENENIENIENIENTENTEIVDL